MMNSETQRYRVEWAYSLRKVDNMKKIQSKDKNELRKMYLDIIRPQSTNIFRTKEFLNKMFTLEKIDPLEIGDLWFKLECENCINLEEERLMQIDQLKFEVFIILEDENSIPFYSAIKEMEEDDGESEKIIVLLEETTGYINSNCQEIQLLLQLERGISERDYIEETDRFWEYVRLVEDIKWYFNEEEQRVFKMWDLIPR